MLDRFRSSGFNYAKLKSVKLFLICMFPLHVQVENGKVSLVFTAVLFNYISVFFYFFLYIRI